MKSKKFLTLALTALLATTTLTTLHNTDKAQAKEKYPEYEYSYKTDSAYTIKEIKAKKNYTSASATTTFVDAYKQQLKNNKIVWGFSYIYLKKNQTVTLQGTKVSVKDGYFVTSGQTKKINKTMKNTNKGWIRDKLVQNSILVKQGVVYLNGKKLTGTLDHKSVKNKELLVTCYNGRVISIQETYF